MAGSVGGGPGGILGLAQLINEHATALEADLIGLGLRLRWLGTERLTWRDLWVIVQTARPDSALAADLYPSAQVSLTDRLLLLVEHRLRLLSWQWSDGKGAPPEMISLPGDTTPVSGGSSWRPEAVSVDEMNEFLGW